MPQSTAMFVRTLLLLAWLCAVPARAEVVSQLLAPAPGTTELGADATFSWSEVAGAQAYYLYIGSTPGAKDVIDSGEVAATSLMIRNLPPATTLYVRTWVKYGDLWRHADAQLATAARAKLLTPAAGATDLPTTVDFSWIRINDAQAYYLYVGRSPGAKDVVDSYELQKTSYRATLPEGETLYVRLWTKRGGHWQYVDAVLATRALTARLLTPAAGAGEVHPRPTLSWTPVPGAAKYYVYVGTTVGARDVVNSGEITVTSLRPKPLEGARLHYLRLYTRVDGTWRYRDYTFTTRNWSTLVDPAPGSTGNDPELLLSWNPVAGAEKYYVYAGGSPGSRDWFNSGELTATAVIARSLPGGETIHVRLWTRHGGAWRWEDQQIGTRAVPRFITPRPGLLGVTAGTSLRWNRVVGAQQYRLDIGTRSGRSDVLSVDGLQSSDYTLPALPDTEALFARVWARVAGRWVFGETAFSPRASLRSAYLTQPVPGGRIEGARLFEWAPAALGQTYRLTIGSSPGSADLHDSGAIVTTRRRVGQLPPGVPLYAQLTTTYVGGRTASRSYTVTAGDMTLPPASRLGEAIAAAAAVRAMADGNAAQYATPLADSVRAAGKDLANCVDYSQALVRVVADLGVGIDARLAATCLVPNSYDCHTLVELRDPDSDRWVLVDPTFGMAMRRAGDDQRAALADMADAVRREDWSAIRYEYLTAQGDAYARDYYLDYPLLFVHPYQPNLATLALSPAPVMGYYSPAAAGGAGLRVFAIACAVGAQSVTALVDGVPTTLACDPVHAVTRSFGAVDVTVTGEHLALLQPDRHVF